MKTDKVILKETIELWQSRTKRKITEEDAREISETLYDFVQLLLSWQNEDQQNGRLLKIQNGKEVA